MKVDVQDILRTPYDDAHNCWWATRTAVLRVWPDMDPSEMPIDEHEIESVVRAARNGEGECPSRWRKIGESAFAATRLGDVLLGVREDGTAHTACLVDDVALQALTSQAATGARLLRAFNIEGIVAVYRRSPA